MRFAPVALRWNGDPAMLVTESLRSALVTHHDPHCQWSTVAVNVALAMTLRGLVVELETLASALDACGAPTEVGDAIGAVVGATLDDLDLDDQDSMGYTLKAMQVSLWCLDQPLAFEAVLTSVVNAGGDTNTNGAVAAAVMGARSGAKGVPDRWLTMVGEIERLKRAEDLAIGMLP